MTPAPTETAELINRLRQQLILAQVRIMELEDDRDRLAARLREVEALLAADDIAVRNYFDQHRSDLQSLLGAARADQVRHHLERFDYEQALALLPGRGEGG